MSNPNTESNEAKRLEDIARRIREGVFEGINREIERRAKAGESIVVQRNGKIETLWPVNGAFPDDPDEDDDVE